MKFRKINQSSFECIITKEDMENLDVTYEDFLSNNAEKIHIVMDNVVEEALEVMNIDITGGVVSMQLTPLGSDSIVLTISSTNANHIRDDEEAEEDEDDEFSTPVNAIGNGFEEEDEDDEEEFVSVMKSLYDKSNKKLREEAEDNVLVYEFKSLTNLVNFCEYTCNLKNVASSLRYNNGKYYLFIEYYGDKELREYQSFILKIDDFGVRASKNKYQRLSILEKSVSIIEKNAIREIRKNLTINI